MRFLECRSQTDPIYLLRVIFILWLYCSVHCVRGGAVRMEKKMAADGARACETHTQTLQWIHAIIDFIRPYSFLMNTHVVNFFQVFLIPLFGSLENPVKFGRKSYS